MVVVPWGRQYRDSGRQWLYLLLHDAQPVHYQRVGILSESCGLVGQRNRDTRNVLFLRQGLRRSRRDLRSAERARDRNLKTNRNTKGIADTSVPVPGRGRCRREFVQEVVRRTALAADREVYAPSTSPIVARCLHGTARCVFGDGDRNTYSVEAVGTQEAHILVSTGHSPE